MLGFRRMFSMQISMRLGDDEDDIGRSTAWQRRGRRTPMGLQLPMLPLEENGSWPRAELAAEQQHGHGRQGRSSTALGPRDRNPGARGSSRRASSTVLWGEVPATRVLDLGGGDRGGAVPGRRRRSSSWAAATEQVLGGGCPWRRAGNGRRRKMETGACLY